MIIDLARFVSAERPHWQALEKILTRLENDPDLILSVTEATRFHELYQRASAALARIETLSSDSDLREYLETLVRRA